MEKSSIYRTLQIASVVAIYVMTSIWASTAHVDMLSDTLTSINSLLVILAIVTILPYVCFKALGKLTTPPASRNINDSFDDALDDLLEVNNSAIATEKIKKEIKTMQYRGTRYKPEKYEPEKYKPESLPDQTIEVSDKSQPVIKYRGVEIEDSADKASQDVTDSFSTARKAQKSALPKERMKYRGSYLD